MGNKISKIGKEKEKEKKHPETFANFYAKHCHSIKEPMRRKKQLATGKVETTEDGVSVFQVATRKPTHSKLVTSDSVQQELIWFITGKEENTKIEYVKLCAPIFANRAVCQYNMHGLAAAFYEAFAFHRPLHISPDHIWLTIAQGFAIHVSENHEGLREKFVNFEKGKKTLTVIADDFVRGSPANDWASKIEDFTQEIAQQVGADTANTLVCNFSTTTPIDKAASGLVLMNAMKEYFDYEVTTLCGIPEIAVSGTLEDWQLVYDRALSLAKFDLAWWTKRLEPILAQFIRLKKEGVVDVVFWDAAYKFYEADGSSGSHPNVTGWLMELFPYLKGEDREYVKNDFKAAPLPSQLPDGTNLTPFKWNYFGAKLDMSLASGFFGVTQTKENRVSANVGYVIFESAKAIHVDGQESLQKDKETREADLERKLPARTFPISSLSKLNWKETYKKEEIMNSQYPAGCLETNETGCSGLI